MYKHSVKSDRPTKNLLVGLLIGSTALVSSTDNFYVHLYLWTMIIYTYCNFSNEIQLHMHYIYWYRIINIWVACSVKFNPSHKWSNDNPFSLTYKEKWKPGEENLIYRVFALETISVGLHSDTTHILGAVSIRKTVLPGMAIPMLKIRRPNGRLIFNMEIAIRR